MEYILHIDTSRDVGTVAISQDGVVLTRIDSTEARNHAALINEMIATAIDRCGTSLADLGAVAVCSGPGSYTGLRIAMATAKGICYAHNLPLIVDDRLSLLSGAYVAQSQSALAEAQHVASILKARENEYFLVIRNGNNMIIVPPRHVEEAEMVDLLRKSESLHIISDIAEDEFYKLSVTFLSIKADISIEFNYWAQVAKIKMECHEYVDLMTATPLYLKQVFTRN